MIEVSIKFPEEMLAALKGIATDEDASVGQLVRDAVQRDLYRRMRAKTTGRSDERLVAPLRSLLADDFNYAKSWAELGDRLARKGFAVAESGGGIILISLRDGRRLCKGSELGHSLSALSRRFAAPFPASDPRVARFPAGPIRHAGAPPLRVSARSS
jgi:hypothetical protein